MGSIYITLVGNTVIASETTATHAKSLAEVFHGIVSAEHLSKVEAQGDVRDVIRVRTVIADLKR